MSVSSAIDVSFFSYYFNSFFSFINYYSGLWVLFLFVMLAFFQIVFYSKRESLFDVFSFTHLSFICLLPSYWLNPRIVGGGVSSVLSEYGLAMQSMLFSFSFLVFIFHCSNLLEVNLITKLNFSKILEFIKIRTLKVQEFIQQVSSQKLLSTNVNESALQVNIKQDVETKSGIDLDNEVEKPFKLEHVPHLSQTPMQDLVEKCTESEKVQQNEDSLQLDKVNQNIGVSQLSFMNDNTVEGENYNGDISQNLNEVRDDEYVDDCEISVKHHGHLSIETNLAFQATKVDESKYFRLAKLNSHKNDVFGVSGPDEKYFQDIINKIHNKLSEFKIEGRIINILKGPVVDTFEWELGAGEKISKLTSAADDLSLALLGAPIRMVYPMKGRGTVGIEVPRNPREFIFLDELVHSGDFTSNNYQLPLAMGKDAFGEPVVVDLASMPHMLVAGATGAGKSVFINSILVSLLVKRTPNQMRLILIDPKQLELALYAKLPHLIMPVITDAKLASTSLLWAVQEMERRYSIMTEFAVRNIEGFNHKLKRADEKLIENIKRFYQDEEVDQYELPYIVIIIDEFADLILTQSGKDIEKNICRLAAKARASGIHLIIATQRPSVDVITGLIKSNFPTRVSFRVTSAVDSRTILNSMGAEKLLGKGDMLYKYGVDTTRIHSSFVEENEIEELTMKLAEMAPTFSQNVLDFLENGGEPNLEDKDLEQLEGSGDGDEKFDEAVRVVMEHRAASASLLQRRLGVGYNRAANLIEEMEARGIVGPAQGSKPRRVLASPETNT